MDNNDDKWNWLKTELSEIRTMQNNHSIITSAQATTLAVNTASLQEHIRRTGLIEDRLKPIERHVSIVNGGFKFIGMAATLATLFLGLFKLMT